MDAVTLDDVVVHVVNAIPYTPKNYPDLAHSNKEEALAFVMNHALLHEIKSLGKIAEMLEPFGHGDQSAVRMEALQKIVVKLLGNAARLMPVVGLSSADFFELLRQEFTGPPTK